jgi:hypothetical protein
VKHSFGKHIGIEEIKADQYQKPLKAKKPTFEFGFLIDGGLARNPCLTASAGREPGSKLARN